MNRGESLSFEIRVVNPGSRTLEQVALSVDLPFGWRAEVAPTLLPSLVPGATQSATVVLAPPPEVVLGDYEGTIRVRSLAGSRLVESEPKTLRLHVTAAGNPWLLLALVFATAVVLFALVRGGMALSRR